MPSEKPKSSEDDFLDHLDLDNIEGLFDEDTKMPEGKKGVEKTGSSKSPEGTEGTDFLGEDDLLAEDDLVNEDTDIGSGPGEKSGLEDTDDFDLDALLEDSDESENDEEKSPAGASGGKTTDFLSEEDDASVEELVVVEESDDVELSSSTDDEEASVHEEAEALGAAAGAAIAGTAAAARASSEKNAKNRKKAKASADDGEGGDDAGEKPSSTRGRGKKGIGSTARRGAGKGGIKGAKVAKVGTKGPRAPKERRGTRATRAAKAAKAAPVKIRGALHFICSECYAEFNLPSSFSSETLTCPECLHVGKRPNEEFLRTVIRHKANEKKSFATAVAVGAVLFLVLLFLVWFQSPFCSLELAAEQKKTWTLGLLGGGGFLTIVFLWLVARFEKNRWDIYF